MNWPNRALTDRVRDLERALTEQQNENGFLLVSLDDLRREADRERTRADRNDRARAIAVHCAMHIADIAEEHRQDAERWREREETARRALEAHERENGIGGFAPVHEIPTTPQDAA